MFGFFFYFFERSILKEPLFFQWAESKQRRYLHVFSFRKWNSFEISELKWHCDTERQHVPSEVTKIKDRARTLPMVQRKGTTPLSGAQKVPQVPTLRAWPRFTKVLGKSEVYTLLWIFSQLSWLFMGAKEMRKECKNFPLFVPGVGTTCFDFSLGLMQLNRIILPPGSPCDFLYEESKLFF